MVTIFQILFIVFSLFAILSVRRRRQDTLLSMRGTVFWILFWLAADGAVLWPESTTMLANRLGIGRGSDLVLYISLVAIFYLLFRLHLKIENVNRALTKVTRDRAMKQIDSKEE